MSLYVLQPYEFDIDEHSSGSQVNKSFNKHGVLLSMVLRCRGMLVPLSERGGSYKKGVFGRLWWRLFSNNLFSSWINGDR